MSQLEEGGGLGEMRGPNRSAKPRCCSNSIERPTKTSMVGEPASNHCRIPTFAGHPPRYVTFFGLRGDPNGLLRVRPKIRVNFVRASSVTRSRGGYCVTLCHACNLAASEGHVDCLVLRVPKCWSANSDSFFLVLATTRLFAWVAVEAATQTRIVIV